ncbi:hypothetical protein E9O_09159 [Moraxella catarrhalis 12P80B1]|nr:hypothetical protein E9O_09159 [Moraxella catarrhalis 12P80B1]
MVCIFAKLVGGCEFGSLKWIVLFINGYECIFFKKLYLK